MGQRVLWKDPQDVLLSDPIHVNFKKTDIKTLAYA